MSSKAQKSKDQGNEAFKQGKYADAVGFYSAAIIENRNEATYPLNRAAAYLKLGKNEDAERDCTTVLKLSPKNVKALFRRGQARMAMDRLIDAQKDFIEALEREPNNEPAREALVQVAERVGAKKEKIARTAAARNVIDPSITPKRRRVPIKIVGSSTLSQETEKAELSIDQPKSGTDTLQAVSSRSLKSGPTSSSSSTTSTPKTEQPPPPQLKPTQPTPISAEKPNTFKEAKEARDNARPSRVGGGIFRATGSSTVFPTRDASTPPAALSSKVPSSKPKTKAPENLFELVRTWGSLKNPEDRWELLTSIPPAKFPSLCKTSLEPAFLVSVLETFQSILMTGDLEMQVAVKEYMDSLSGVSRFSTIVLFLSKAEKDLARDVWRRLGVEKPEGVWSAL